MISKKQFIRGIFIVILLNVICIAGILGFVNARLKAKHLPGITSDYYNRDLAFEADIKSELMEGSTAYIDQAPNNEYLDKSVYYYILPGTYSTADNDYTFAFSFGGDEYEGYFNKENKHVEGYSYYIDVAEVPDSEDDKTIDYLVVRNPNKQIEVKYRLDVNDRGSIVLSNVENGERFILASGGAAYVGEEPKEVVKEDSKKASDENNESSNQSSERKENEEVKADNENSAPEAMPEPAVENIPVDAENGAAVE